MTTMDNNMISISPQAAREIFITSGCGLICQHESGLFAGDPEGNAYISSGCVVIHSPGRWSVYDPGKWSDIKAAYGAVKPLMTDGEKLNLYPRCPLPEGWSEMKGEFRLARGYSPYEDGEIRNITPDDMPAIETLCEYDEEDNRFGHKLTSEFLGGCRNSPGHFFSPGFAFGLFDKGELSGFINGGHMGYIGATVINLFVARQKRGRGFASRLLRALCASDPGAMYGYSCEKDNLASYRTALSCGFVPVGESLEAEGYEDRERIE